MRCRIQSVAITVLAVALSACSGMGVQPWERGILARPDMVPNSAPMTNALDDHIYFSKEASSGGRSFAGGGCGCN